MSNNRSAEQFLYSPFIQSFDLDTQQHEDSSAAPSHGEMQMLFSLGGSIFGVPVVAVSSVSPRSPVETLPFLGNPNCRGFVTIQGRSVPLADIRAILGMSSIDRAGSGPMLIISHDHLLTAIPTDGVIGVERCVPISTCGQITNSDRTIARCIGSGNTVTTISPEMITSALTERFP